MVMHFFSAGSFFVGLMLFFGSCKGQEQNENNFSAEREGISHALLTQTWYFHSKSSDQVEYHSSKEDLPPARFREQIIFEPNNRVTRYQPGADDSPGTRSGSWKLMNDSVLLLTFDGNVDTLLINALTETTLRLKIE